MLINKISNKYSDIRYPKRMLKQPQFDDIQYRQKSKRCFVCANLKKYYFKSWCPTLLTFGVDSYGCSGYGEVHVVPIFIRYPHKPP